MGLLRITSVPRSMTAWVWLEMIRYRANVLLDRKAKAERGQAVVKKKKLFPTPF